MNAQTIMVCSGKGGTGKSTIAVLVGAHLAALNKKVLLIELDSGLRSVDIIAGVYGKTVYVADGGPDGAAAMLVNHDSRLTRVIKVEGGQPVTVEYMAKAVETPAN